MKPATYLSALGLFGLMGCVFMPPAVPTTTTPSDRAAQPAAPPVRPEQITADNAQKMSQALAEELDREAQRGVTPTALPK
jgi:hypothetical protein